jgi:hypothetical protein
MKIPLTRNPFDLSTGKPSKAVTNYPTKNIQKKYYTISTEKINKTFPNHIRNSKND